MDRGDIKMNVERRLESLGYTAVASDDWVIDFIIDKTENYIKSNCNIIIIPDELLQVTVDMICGEFLNTKKNSGGLDINGLNFDIVNKSIQEGDTKVEFYTDGIITADQMFAKLIQTLTGRKDELSSYRCVKW